MEKITFKNLGWSIKIPLIYLWTHGILATIYFSVGFVQGILEII